MQRSTMQNAISAPKVGGIVRLTKFILKGTFLLEAAGALLLLPVFLPDYGLKGIWMAVFHSISAFCNAGFDILGTAANTFPSLTRYSGNILVNVVIMLLIIIGGIGFLTWDDIYTNRRAGSGNCGGIRTTSFREKNIPYAKKYYAECDFGPQSRRNCQVDKVYFKGNLFT